MSEKNKIKKIDSECIECIAYMEEIDGCVATLCVKKWDYDPESRTWVQKTFKKSKDKLDTIFERQIEFQKMLGNEDLKFNVEFIMPQVIALIDELMEALRNTPWKSWKKQQRWNKEEFKEELVDVWHFTINLTLASGMDAKEFFKKFIEKNDENINRQKRGY